MPSVDKSVNGTETAEDHLRTVNRGGRLLQAAGCCCGGCNFGLNLISADLAGHSPRLTAVTSVASRVEGHCRHSS